MKDIPFFTTEYGVASLTLEQIPYKKCAYIRLQSTDAPQLLLNECATFCRACGAEQLFATGNPILQALPLDTTILSMGCLVAQLPKTDASLFPVTEKTLEDWRKIYNERMCSVPHAAYMSRQQAKKLLTDKDAYFVHKNGSLLGIGKASCGKIDTLASVKKGAGQDVLLALSSITPEGIVRLEVSDKNSKALNLYQRLGFTATNPVVSWYVLA